MSKFSPIDHLSNSQAENVCEFVSFRGPDARAHRDAEGGL